MSEGTDVRPTGRRRVGPKQGRKGAASRKGGLNGRTAVKLTAGAAAAERASAGMGTAELEPADWLFGDSLQGSTGRPY
jgi:hypothetical protein